MGMKQLSALLQTVGERIDEGLAREPFHVNFCGFGHPLPHGLPPPHEILFLCLVIGIKLVSEIVAIDKICNRIGHCWCNLTTAFMNALLGGDGELSVCAEDCL